ncbi:DUF6879 family protein [Streptomyces rubiginosohelvolus]|uniref:DUF6879 family protein n=1 Tax=Streptomyces rubiginosohelvolus TaxID=67362 RepID=UPI0033BDD000
MTSGAHSSARTISGSSCLICSPAPSPPVSSRSPTRTFSRLTDTGPHAYSEVCDDPQAAERYAQAYDAAWQRGIPHEEYRPG